MRPSLDPRAVALAAALVATTSAAYADTVSSVMHVIITIAGDCTIDVEVAKREPDSPLAFTCTAAAPPIVSRDPVARDGAEPVEVVTLSF